MSVADPLTGLLIRMPITKQQHGFPEVGSGVLLNGGFGWTGGSGFTGPSSIVTTGAPGLAGDPPWRMSTRIRFLGLGSIFTPVDGVATPPNSSSLPSVEVSAR